MQLTHKTRPMVLTAALVLALPLAGLASGTYTSRPPRPPVKASGEKIDSARYELGKRIYNGKAQLGTGTGTAGDNARLNTLQGRLPEKEQKKANLSALSGKLTAEQLDALEYYIAHRFPQK